MAHLSETAIAFARSCSCGIETGIAFAGAGRASNETGIAFAGENWVFLARFSLALVLSVSMVAVLGRALVMLVSRWSASAVAVVMVVSQLTRGCVLCAKKFALRGLVVGVSAKKFAQRTKNGPKWRFLACWAEFFAEMPLEGLCWASFFAIQQPQVPVGELCRAVALAAGPLLAVLTLRCAATPYGWHGGQPARATTHRVNLRMKGPGPPAVGSSAAAGCNVRRLGVARKRSGVMCGWLCSRVRIGPPRPNPGGALPQPTIRRSAVPPEWRT